MTREIKAHLQLKGTDVCMDWVCPCGVENHTDGITFGTVICEGDSCLNEKEEGCGRKFSLSSELTLIDKKED